MIVVSILGQRHNKAFISLLDEVTPMSDSMSDVTDDPTKQANTPVSGIILHWRANIKLVLYS